MTTPRGIRNNNPGNIRYVEGITSTYQGCVGSDGAFCRFDTSLNGLRALCLLLLSYQRKRGLRTVRQIINRWAPPEDNNDTAAYIRAVSTALRVDDTEDLDLSRPSLLAALCTAIVDHENGQQPYTAAEIAEGAQLALGMPATTQPAAPIEERPQTNLPPVQPPEPPMPEESSPFDWSAVTKTVGAVASFFNPFVGAAISALSPLLQQKIESTVARHTDPATAKVVANNISDVIGKVISRETGISDPFQSVVAMQKSPDIIAKVEAAVVDRLEQMAPFLDKLHQQSKDEWQATEQSMSAAVERTNASEIGALIQKSILWFAEGMVLIATIFTGCLIAYQMVKKDGAEPSGQLMILFAMLVTMSANTVRSIADWAFGSSKTSAAKDLTLNEFAAGRATTSRK